MPEKNPSPTTRAALKAAVRAPEREPEGAQAPEPPRTQPPAPARIPERAVVRHADDVESKPVAAGTAAETQMLLGPADGAPHFALRRFTMGEGGGMPRHTNTVEHEQYVLRGRARVGVGDQVHEVGPDDVLLIPAGAPHFYEVVEAPFVFLCAVPNQLDTIEIVDESC